MLSAVVLEVIWLAVGSAVVRELESELIVTAVLVLVAGRWGFVVLGARLLAGARQRDATRGEGSLGIRSWGSGVL